MNDAVRVCPNCGSTDIGHDSVSAIARLSLTGARECRSCGYSGIFPEAERDAVEDMEVPGDVDVEALPGTGFRKGRFVLGALLLLLGLGATAYASWGNGLLAGLLALAVGAAVMGEELSNRFGRAQ